MERVSKKEQAGEVPLVAGVDRIPGGMRQAGHVVRDAAEDPLLVECPVVDRRVIADVPAGVPPMLFVLMP